MTVQAEIISVSVSAEALTASVDVSVSIGGGGSDYTLTKEAVDDVIGASETGSATKFYNQQGDFVEITIPDVQPEFETTILKGDVVWDGLFIKITTDEATNGKLIKNITFKVDTTEGERTLQPIVVYPSAETYSGVVENCFLIRDSDGYLTPDIDFDSVYLAYDIATDTNVKYDSKYALTGEGVVDNHNSTSGEETEHSRFTAALFKGIIPDFTHSIIRTDQNSTANYSKLAQSFQPTFCFDNDCNMIFTPYVNAAVNEDVRSNSGLIEIATHYGNDFERHDITANADTFLKNTIAVSARSHDLNDNTFGTSYGFGLEFFEDLTPSYIDADYPDKTVEDYVCGFTTDENGNILTSTLHPTFVPDTEIETGDVVWWFNNGEKEEAIVQSILSDNSISIEPAFTPSTATTRYLIALLRVPVAIKQHGAEGYHGTQSWATPIIAAKFKQIRLETGASWEQIRTAARETASNGGVWDMYRGFGIIDVDSAVQYITDNYQTAELKEAYAYQLEDDRRINPLIEYSELKDNSPVAKRHAVAELAKKSDTTHNHSGVYAPVIHTHAGQSINPDNIVLDKSYTDAQAAALAVGTLFYNSDQLCWLLKTSTVTYLNMGEELPMLCKNGDTVTHLEGQAVYITSGTGKFPVLQLTNSTIGKCSALATQDVLHTGSSRGYYCFFGQTRTFPYANVIKSTDNAANWVEGAKLYLCSENGRYSTVKEVAPAKSMEVATITDRSGANISVIFNPIPTFAVEELSNVDGEATTVATGNSFFLKVGTLWKYITESNFAIWLKTFLVATDDSRLSDSRPASDVYSWAKAATKPTYTYTEVGAQPAGTYSTDIHSNITALNAVSGTNTGNEVAVGTETPTGNEDLWIDTSVAEMTTADLPDSTDKRYVSDYQQANKFGSGNNYAQFASNGHMTLNGTATVFEDLNFSPLSAGGAAATLPDYVTIGNVVYREFTSANNQKCGDSREFPHATKLGAVFSPHAHIFLKNGESAGTTGVTFTLYWELRQSTGTTNGSVTLSATTAQLQANANKVNVTGTDISGSAELGGQLTVLLARTAGDAGDVVVMTYGVHYEIDTMGSNEITTK